MADALTVLRQVILLNELGGDLSHCYQFSDPDGVRSGKSGWSFGLCQFDISNNPAATLCLRECGYTTDEIRGLKDQTIEMGPMNDKLALATKIVDRWDAKQLFECLMHPANLCRESKITIASEEVPFHLSDYHNQFYMSGGGKMHRFLQSLDRAVVPDDILKFKLATLWGEKRPDDVHRRFDNVRKVVDNLLQTR